jgi:hypothetical protein
MAQMKNLLFLSIAFNAVVIFWYISSIEKTVKYQASFVTIQELNDQYVWVDIYTTSFWTPDMPEKERPEFACPKGGQYRFIFGY